MNFSEYIKDGSGLIWTIRSCRIDNSFSPFRKEENRFTNFIKLKFTFPHLPFRFCPSGKRKAEIRHANVHEVET